MTLRPTALLACAALAACTQAPAETLLEHHGAATEMRGLARESGPGPFHAGAVERLRAVYDTAAVQQVRWAASAGVLTATGDRAEWTLPRAGDAELTVTMVKRDGSSSDATWTFHVVDQPSGRHQSAREALLGTPMPVLDGGVGAEITGGACNLEYDASGNIHLAFTSSTHPGLYYGRWNGTTWTVELVDGMGFNTGGDVNPGRIAMAVDGAGNPHIAYVIKSTIAYATKAGASWTRERVDGAPVANDVEVSLALNPAASLRPTIAYHYASPSYQRTAIATRTSPGAWTVATPLFTSHTTIYDQRLMGDIAFNPAGTLFLPMYLWGNSSTGVTGYYLASWTTSATAQVRLNQTGLPGFDTEETNFAWAGPSRLLARTRAGVYDIAINSTLANSTFTWSPSEQSGTPVGDLAWGQGKPTILHLHGGNLELVTPNAQGFFTYTQLGSSSSASASIALHPTTGAASICYQSGNRIMFQ